MSLGVPGLRIDSDRLKAHRRRTIEDLENEMVLEYSLYERNVRLVQRVPEPKVTR